jgi:hypothetical protein
MPAEEGEATMTMPTLSVEVIPLPVSDVERALRFYVDQVGFTLDIDYSPNDAFRVVQLTPPDSCCSIQMGKEAFADTLGLQRYALYVFDYGAPILTRVSARACISTL